jgi:hypothetical protein
VRAIFAATERGDFSSAQWADPGVEYVLVDALEPNPAAGLAGLAEAMSTGIREFEDFHMEAEEYRELDDERVLVLTRAVGVSAAARRSAQDRGKCSRSTGARWPGSSSTWTATACSRTSGWSDRCQQRMSS